MEYSWQLNWGAVGGRRRPHETLQITVRRRYFSVINWPSASFFAFSENFRAVTSRARLYLVVRNRFPLAFVKHGARFSFTPQIKFLGRKGLRAMFAGGD
jgi:hypothetical protein